MTFAFWLLSTIGATLFQGIVLIKLYTWFLLSKFPALPSLGLAEAIGVGLIISYTTHQYRKPEEGEEQLLNLFNWIKPALFLFIGWIVVQFV